MPSTTKRQITSVPNQEVIKSSSVNTTTYSLIPTLNTNYFKQIIQAQLSGKVVLPHHLGLHEDDYLRLSKILNNIEPSSLSALEQEWHNNKSLLLRERALLCEKLFSYKDEEKTELINLLLTYRDENVLLVEEMSTVIATACLTSHHLWLSLGLSARTDLGDLIKYNFPALYARNTNNMRWKRFFYLNLCEMGGDYICRSPSCNECKSYKECFV